MTPSRLRLCRLGCVVIGAFVVIASSARPVAAQPAQHRGLELGGAIVLSGPSSSLSSDATLTRPGGTPLTLFATSDRIDTGFGAEAHLTFPLTSRLAAEATGTWLRTDLTTRVSGDFEGADPITLAQSMSEVGVEGAGVWMLRDSGRLQPFVRAGAGWMRQVTADQVLLQDGLLGSVGGGIKYWLATRSRSRIQRFGLRIDGRLLIRSRSLLLGDRRTVSPALSGGLAIGF